MRPRSTDTLYDIDGDVLDILRDNDVDFEIASASTVSNLPGPGRTLGKILGSSGRAVELVCNKIAGRVGRSPHAEMARLVRALLPARIGPCKERGHGFMCCSCAYRRVLDRVQSGQPDMIVVLDAIILLTMFDGDGATPQSTRALDKRCRKLLKHLRRDDLPSRNTAVYYVIALTTLLPRLARVFQKNGVQQLLTGIVNELSNREPLLYDESLLLARSRKALVSTLQSDALTVVKEYDQFEQIVEWKESLILERDPNHPERARLMNYMSVLVEKSLLADVEVSYVASLPVIRTFTTMNLWLSDLVQRDIVYLTDVFDGPRITQWLKVVASTRDPLQKIIGVQLLNALFKVAPYHVNGHPWIFENLWLPLCESPISWEAYSSCDDRNLSPLQLQYKIKLPWSISHGVETRLHADTAHRLRSLQGVSSPVCDELESTDFRLMGRFMHEWNATCTPWSTETHVLGFPTAIPLSELRLLCYRLVDIDIHSEEISDVVNTITQKDRDACDMILDILRNRLLAYEGDEHKQLSYRYDLFSFVFKLRWIVKITLHGMVQIFDRYRPYPTSLPKAINGSVLWRQPGPRRGEYIISRNYMHDRYRERLIGDWRSLRWVPSTELPRRSNCYSPIIGSLDEAQRPQYIACIGTRDHHDPSAKLFLVGDDLQLQKSDASEWTDLMAANKNPCLYVLASRLLSTEQGKERSAIPHIYWASPEWGYVLCTCCNVGCRDSNDVFGNWHSDTRKIHIPEAILDVKLINAVSLEETVVKGGDNREIYIATWCDGGPRLSWKRNSWNVLPAEVEDDMIIVQHPLLTRELLTDADMISDVVDGERGLFAMKGNEQLEEGRLSEEYQRNSVKDGWTMSMRRPEWPKSRESIRLL